MSITVPKLPDVKPEPDGCPEKCPSCGYAILEKWGGKEKQLCDRYVKQVVLYRYRCCRCRYAFRQYPAGVDQAQQSQRLRKLAAVCWALVLSYRAIEGIFTTIAVGVDHMTAWRDVQERDEHLRKQRMPKPVWVLGLDGTYVRGWGETSNLPISFPALVQAHLEWAAADRARRVAQSGR